MNAPFTIAAPSFVLRAGVPENARFLKNFFPEIGLLFFETQACLNYTETDLPPALADLHVSWHVHLPLDLPWQHGLDAVCRDLEPLIKKVDLFAPERYVLHPPDGSQLAPLAERLRNMGVNPADILLENTEEGDLADIWPEAVEAGFSACLDIGHMLAYSQQRIMDLPGLWDRVRMLHIYAPGTGARHQPLAGLDRNGRKLLKTMLARLEPGNVVTLEVFEEQGLFASAELLVELTAKWRNRP